VRQNDRDVSTRRSPFLNADGEHTVPSQICIFGMTGGHKRWTMIQLSENVDLPLEQQLRLLPEYMHTLKGNLTAKSLSSGGFLASSLYDFSTICALKDSCLSTSKDRFVSAHAR
jgi:hypothetical protein